MAIDIQDEYSEQIERSGAIMFVGSNNRTQFNEMGQEHFDYLIHKNLKPHHVFLDVGCGALRTGQYVIPYLNNKNYYGLDRMPELIEYGLNDVLPQETVFEKEPKCDFTVVISEKKINKNISENLTESDMNIIRIMINKLSTKEITDILSKSTKVSKKEIYNYCLKLKNEK